MCFFYEAVGPPPQARVQGVLWFYARHWLTGVVIFPVYIFVFSATVWAIARSVARSHKDDVPVSDQ